MTRYALIVIMALGIALCALGCSKDQKDQEEREDQEYVPVPQTDAGKIVIAVNGEPVTEQELAQEVARLMQMRARGLDPRDLESTRRAMRGEAVENAINRLLLKQEVQKRKIEVPNDLVEERFLLMKEDFGSEEVFKSRIERMGFTEEEFRKQIEIATAIEQLVQQQFVDLPEPSEEELSAHYNDNIENYTHPEQIRASHILVTVNPADDEKVRQEKRARAEELLEKVKAGANFAQLAMEHSDCPSKSRGGDLNFFSRGDMVKEFSTAAFALDVGGISDIVETKFGYHIIKVTDLRESRVVPYDEAKRGVKVDFENKMKERAMEEFLGRLRAGARIEFQDSTFLD